MDRSRTVLVAFLLVVSAGALAQAPRASTPWPSLTPTEFAAHSYAANSGETVECDSVNSEMSKCSIPSYWQGVRLVNQLSRSACSPGEDFGYDHRGVMWVDNGCRGVFANDSVYDDDGNRDAVGNGGGGGTVECDSANNEMSKCSIPPYWQGVRLVKQLSRSPCTPAQDFGYDHRGVMWVDNGCRGVFANDSPY